MTITPTPSEPSTTYQPTPEQEERAAALRRFNRLFVYAPLGLVALIVLTLVVLMFWTRFAPDVDGRETAEFLSGLVDIIVIFTLAPMLLLCAVGPALAGFLIYRANQRRQLPPPQRRSRLQTLLWRLERGLVKVQTKLRDEWLRQGAEPVIRGHAIMAYVKAVFNYIQRILTGSNPK